MEKRTISSLPSEQMRLIKQIFIVTESKQNFDLSLGYILYERRFSSNYKFKTIPPEKRDFNYYINYRNLDIYPNDNIDALLLQSIQNSFPKSFVKNHSIIFNVDEENATVLMKLPFEKSSIRITPDFRSVDIFQITGIKYDGLIKEMKIYSTSAPDDIKNLSFFGYYDISDTNILYDIEKIKIL